MSAKNTSGASLPLNKKSMQTKFTLEVYEKQKHLASILKIFEESWGLLVDESSPYTQAGAEIWLNIDGGKRQIRVAVTKHPQEQVLGFITYLFDLRKKKTHIELLATNQAYRKQGVGGALLKFVIDETRSKHWAKVSLHTGAKNLPAQSVYLNLGFTVRVKRILLETKIQTHEVQTPLSAEMKKKFIEDTYEQLKSTNLWIEDKNDNREIQIERWVNSGNEHLYSFFFKNGTDSKIQAALFFCTPNSGTNFVYFLKKASWKDEEEIKQWLVEALPRAPRREKNQWWCTLNLIPHLPTKIEEEIWYFELDVKRDATSAQATSTQSSVTQSMKSPKTVADMPYFVWKQKRSSTHLALYKAYQAYKKLGQKAPQ